MDQEITNEEFLSEEEQRKLEEIAEKKRKEPKVQKEGAKFDSATHELEKQRKKQFEWF